MSLDFVQLHEASLSELVRTATEHGVADPTRMRRSDLVFAIIQAFGNSTHSRYGRGVLEVHGEGFGFLRSPEADFLPSEEDIYVSQSQIRRFKLRTGDTVIGLVREPKDGERYNALLRVETVNGEAAGIDVPPFEALPVIHPDDRIHLGTEPWLRALDLAAPLGLGQRGILSAPARTGRTTLLRFLADELSRDEDLDVTVLLVSERPEEIQEWRESTRAEVIATPFDESFARHMQVADITFERARRMAERGDHVVLLVESLSRLLRACQAEIPPCGREIGGVDASALYRIRRFMGSARAFQERGTLTVLATLTGIGESRADQVLLDDLHDSANWEAHLSRNLADRGLWPPIDVKRSATRREERLLAPEEREARATWRASLTGEPLEDAASLLAQAATPLDSTPPAGQ